MALAVLPEDQSKTLGNLQITLIPAADVVEVEEVEVALEAVAVAVEVLVVVQVVQVVLEVNPGGVANDSASRDD